jgi:Undecaprenyl-phosphate galactose phosphotransferase WbaP
MSAAAVLPIDLSRTRRTAFRPRCWIPAVQALTDVLALELAFVFGAALRAALSPWLSVSLAPAQVRGIALGLLAVPCGYVLVGLYPGYGLAPVERLRRRVRANFFVFSGLIAWGYLVHRERWSRGVLLATLLFVLLLSPLVERLLIRLLCRLDLWGTSVVVFGTRESGRAVAELMRLRPSLGLVPVAVLEIDSGQSWTGVALAAVADLYLRSAGLEPARVAVVAMTALEESRRRALLETLSFRCVIVMSDIAQIQTQSITTVEIGTALGLAMNRNLLVPWNRWLKRALDMAAGCLLLLASAPLIAISAIWIRRASGGPVLYSQERVGCGGRTIRVWKLRTMYREADRLLMQCLARDPELRREWESGFKLRRDPRVVPGAGRFLRRTSLDELPQFWNVVTGQMSLVGPRPFPRYHLERFDPEFLRLRECVRPGLTGLWQVSGRSDGDLRAQKALDTYYIRNWSLWLDIEIAIRTVRAVIRGNGAY